MEKELFKKDYSNVKIINFLIYSVVVIMPFIIIPGTRQPFMTGKVIYLYLIFLGIFLLVIIDKMRINIKLEEKIVFLFLLSLIVATAFSIDTEIAIIGKTGRYEGFIMYVIYITLFIVSTRYNEIFKGILEVASIFSIIMGVYSIFQFYNIDPFIEFILPYESPIDIYGTIGNRNYVGTYFIIFLAIAVSIYVIYNKKRYLLYSSVAFAGLLATLTRSCWLAFVVVAGAGLLLVYRRKDCLKRGIILCIVFCSIFAVMNITSNYRIISRTNELIVDVKDFGKESGSGRIEVWKIVLASIKEKPVIGSGLDNLESKLISTHSDQFWKIASESGIIDKAHNEFLEYWACGGIVTVLSYISLISVILYKLFKYRENDISKIFMLTIIGYIVQSIFNNSVIAVAPIYWIVLGAAVKHYRDLDKAKEVQALKE